MDKKGELQLNTVKVVLVSLLILAVLAIAMFLLLSSLTTTFESAETLRTGTINQTETTITEVAQQLTTISGLRNCKFTPTLIVNNSEWQNIDAANYTITNCWINSKGGAGNLYNNTDWRISGTYTYNSPWANDVMGNITSGSTNFFKQMPTLFTLLGVVLIILLIALVIATVSRFGGGIGFGGRSSGSSDYL